MPQVLAIDQGTTSTRSIVFDAGLVPVASAQEEFAQHFPASGWVEHDPDDLWQTSLRTARTAMARAGGTRGGHRHHQPARDHAGLGPRHRQGRSIRRSSGRIAAPPISAPGFAPTASSRR